MGNIHCFRGLCKKDIIKDKSLDGIKLTIEHLKENLRRDVRTRDLFRASRHDGRIKHIANEIGKGGKSVNKVLEDCTLREVAAGLQFYLISLKKPLIQPQIQALALDENPGVPPETIAQDILGLLKDSLEGNHANLIEAILDLLYSVVTCAPADELAGCCVPVSMLPIFFQLRTEHITQWRRVAMIFVEMIKLAPSYFEVDTEDSDDERDNYAWNYYYRRGVVNNALLQQRLLEMNVALRRYVLRTGR
ncbi:uncharacterized protein [Onthophagus taurus]|uniref:uncharacterized protein isoform X2 n=1 Tax=Onthophagus taurus TaxID=166361 RepID=UPI000C206CE5|nr:uncharacterized protein LOC111427555 isoform X2 [Onthophagus taurus]